MTLPNGTTIRMSQVNVELGRPANAFISLNDPAVRALAGKPSGTIRMSDLWGKTAGGGGGIGHVAAFNGSFTGLTGIAFNVADATRRVVAAIGWTDSGGLGRTLSSATIGGVAATIHTQFSHASGNSGDACLALISAPVTAGTSGTIVCNMSGGGTSDFTVGSWSLYGFSGAANDVDIDAETGSGIPSFSIAKASGGVLIGAARSSSNTSGLDHQWFGATQVFEFASANGLNSGAWQGSTSAGGETVSMDYTTTAPGSSNCVLAALTWV